MAKKRSLYTSIDAELARHFETRKDIADLLGVSYIGVSKRMRGLIEWKIREIEILMKHFNLSYEELFKKGE